MKHYDSILDETADLGKVPRVGPKKLLNTPSPTGLASKQRLNASSHATSRGQEFTPMLHTVRKDLNNRESPALSKPIPQRARPAPLLNYQHGAGDDSSMISFGHSFSDQDSTPVPTNPNALKTRVMVTDDPNGAPLREQARHVDTLERENTDLKVKLQLMSKKLLMLSKGKPLSDVTNDSNGDGSELLRAKCIELEERNNALQKELDSSQANQRVTELEEDLKDRDLQLDQYAQRIDDYETKIEDLVDKLKNHHQSDLSNEDGDSETSVTTLKNNLEDIKYENRQLQEELDKAYEDNARLQEQIDEEIHANDSQQSDLRHTEKLKEEVEDLRQDNKKLAASLQEAETIKAELFETQSKVQELMDANERLERERQILENVDNDASNHVAQANVSSTIRDLRYEHEEQLRALKHEISLLNGQLLDLRKVNERHETEAQEYRTEISYLKDEIASSNALSKRIKSESESARTEKEFYQDQLAEAQDQILKLSRKANESIVAVYDRADLDSAKQKLAETTNEYNNQSRRWEEERGVLNEKIRSLQRLKDSMERQLDSFLSKEKSGSHWKEVLDTEKDKFNAEKQILQREMDLYKQKSMNFENENLSLTQKIQILKEELDTKSQESAFSNTELSSATLQIESLKSSLHEAQKEHFKLQSEIDSQKITIDMLKESQIAEKETTRDLEEKLSASSKELELVKESLKESQRQIGHLEVKLDHSELKAADAEQTRADIEEETEKDLDRVAEELRNAMSQIKELKSRVNLVDELERENDRFKLRLKRSEAQVERLVSQSGDGKQRSNSGSSRDEVQKMYLRYQEERKYADTLKEEILILEQELENAKRVSQPSRSELELSSHKEKYYRQSLSLYSDYVKFNKMHLRREMAIREDLEFTKNYLMAKSGKFLASNIKSLNMLSDIGLYPNYRELRNSRRTFRAVAYTVLATVLFESRLEDYRRYKGAYKNFQHQSRRIKELQ